MKVTPLPLETITKTGFTHKFTVTYADLTTAGPAHPLTLVPEGGGTTGTIAAGHVIRTAGFRVTTGFATTNGSSVTLDIGRDSGTEVLLADIPLQFGTLDGSEKTYWVSAPDETKLTLPYVMATAGYLVATFTIGGGSSPLCTELTAGVVEIYLGIFNLNDLAND